MRRAIPFLIATLLISCAQAEKPNREEVAIEKISDKLEDKKKDDNVKSKTEERKSILAIAEEKYSQSKSVKMKVKKTLVLSLLETKKEYFGNLYIKHKGKLRLEIEKPQKSLVVIDGKIIWSVTFPADPEFDNTTRVLKATSPKRAKSQALVAFLLGQGQILGSYDIKDEKVEKNDSTFVLKPKDEKSQIKTLEIVVDRKSELIKTISYFDELENKTIFEFSKTQFNKNLSDSEFTYKPPKGAEITEI